MNLSQSLRAAPAHSAGSPSLRLSVSTSAREQPRRGEDQDRESRRAPRASADAHVAVLAYLSRSCCARSTCGWVVGCVGRDVDRFFSFFLLSRSDRAHDAAPPWPR